MFFNKKRIVTSELNEEIHPALLCFNLIMPFILFSVLPLIAIECLGEFDLYLYSLSFSNAILSSDDLLNIVLQFFVKPNEGGYKKLFIIPNNYDYLIESEDLLESNYIKSDNIEVIEETFAESTVESDFDNKEDKEELSSDINNNELEVLYKNETEELNIDSNKKIEDINIEINEEIKDTNIDKIEKIDVDSNVNEVELEFNDHITDINDIIHG